MSEEIRKDSYEQPSIDVIEIAMNDGVLQVQSPGVGGGEGIGGGTDL